MRVGRIATVVVVVLGILWIPVMKGLGKVLYAYLQDVQSLLAPGIAAVFLLGIASRKTTPMAGLGRAYFRFCTRNAAPRT